jgi:hypothetical protein
MISIVRELVYGWLVLSSGLRVLLTGGRVRHHADTGGYSDAIKRQNESSGFCRLSFRLRVQRLRGRRV